MKQVTNFHTWLEGSTRNDVPVEGLRACEAITYKNGKGIKIQGRFHCWGINYEEYETGPGNFTTAIIELDDGEIMSCPAETVQFLDREGD